jgi:hypothetical protein
MANRSISNDNKLSSETPVRFSDLAAGMHMDEDTLLRQFASILNKREHPELDATPLNEASE